MFRKRFINCSDIEASGPKGLTKNDVVSHIQSKGLKPLDLAAAPPPQAAPKAAAATSDGKVKRPNFERPATARREDSGPIKSGNARYTGIDHSSHLQTAFDFEHNSATVSHVEKKKRLQILAASALILNWYGGNTSANTLKQTFL